MARLIKEMIILGLAAFAGLYLIFPSFLPDFIPFIGWIDEGVATLIILNTLSYYGISLTNLYGDKGINRDAFRDPHGDPRRDPRQYMHQNPGQRSYEEPITIIHPDDAPRDRANRDR